MDLLHKEATVQIRELILGLAFAVAFSWQNYFISWYLSFESKLVLQLFGAGRLGSYQAGRFIGNRIIDS